MIQFTEIINFSRSEESITGKYFGVSYVIINQTPNKKITLHNHLTKIERKRREQLLIFSRCNTTESKIYPAVQKTCQTQTKLDRVCAMVTRLLLTYTFLNIYILYINYIHTEKKTQKKTIKNLFRIQCTRFWCFSQEQT